MNTQNQITIRVIKKFNGRETTNPIGPWIQFFKVHNFYANKTTRQIEYYLKNYRICITFRGRETTLKLRDSYFILLPKLTQSRLPDPNILEITFTLTKEEINTWLTGTPFKFEGNNEDIFGSNRRENDLKIRPRVVDENFRSRHIQFEIQNEWGIQDLNEFLDIMRKPTFGLLKKWLRLHNGIRANFCVTATYEREGQREIIATEPMHLQTQNHVFLRETNLDEMYDNITNYIIGRHENISENLEGTQWVLVSIDSFRININRFDPLRAGSFMELPKTLASKKVIINVKNEKDNKCYLWSILAGLFPVEKDAQRITKYKHYEHIFDKALEGMEFPMKVKNNNKFVNRVNKLNLIEGGLSDNIYHHNKQYKIYPLSDITKDEKKNHVDLLYLKKDKGNSHYCLIKDLWKLVARQETKNCKKRYLYKMCLNSFPCEKVLSDHKNYCGLNKPAKVVLPDKADNIIEFKNYKHSMKVPFAIYADFESLIKKLNKMKQLSSKVEKLSKKLNKTKEEVEKYESYTIKLQRHFPISFVYYIKYANGEIKQNLFEYSPLENQSTIYSYFGLDAPKKLYEKLRENVLFIAKEYLDKKIKMKQLSETQKIEYKNAKKCHTCERKLKDTPPSIEKEIRILNKKIDIICSIILKREDEKELWDKLSELVEELKNKYEREKEGKIKVRDHDHLTGEYRGVAHSNCNLNYKIPRFIPIYFHNFFGYDAHLFIREFGDNYDDIKLIPNNEEKYISFSKVLKYDSGWAYMFGFIQILIKFIEWIS
ncbi:MAG: hypothetical protein H9Q67_04825 [Spiroplasma ixodetis]|nr:hypothetical protein [Spiroplasma ixodetis]